MYTQFEEKGKIFTPHITKNPILVILQTTSHLIKGKIHIKPDERIKDSLRDDDPFLAMTDATIYSPTGHIVYQTHFLAIHQSHIIWLTPESELITDPSQA